MSEPMDQAVPGVAGLNYGKAIDLWQYFESVGFAARNQMITTAGWFLVIAIAALSYAGESLLSGAETFESLVQLLIAGIGGICVCLLNLYLINEFRKHTERNWLRATRFKRLVPGLFELVTEEPTPPEFPTKRRSAPGSSRVSTVFEFYKMFTIGIIIILGLVIALRLIDVELHKGGTAPEVIALLDTPRGQAVCEFQ